MDFFPAVRPSSSWLYGMLLALGILALSAAAIAIGANHLRGPLLRALAARTGHPIRVDGEFAVQLLARHPSVTATQVSIGNPAWMPPGDMAQIGRVSLTLAWQWAAMPLAIHRVELEQATLHLVREQLHGKLAVNSDRVSRARGDCPQQGAAQVICADGDGRCRQRENRQRQQHAVQPLG